MQIIVNALPGFTLISTGIKDNSNESTSVCQCPVGLCLHFYKEKLRTLGAWYMCVNALSSFAFISTDTLNCLYLQSSRCVNALSGFAFISTLMGDDEIERNQVCQCPVGLILHFYAKG